MTCVGLQQTSQRNISNDAIANEEVSNELLCAVCPLGGVELISSGGLDLRCELRVGELVVSVLMLFPSWKLFHSLRVYSFFDLVSCGTFFGGLTDLLCIAKNGSA